MTKFTNNQSNLRAKSKDTIYIRNYYWISHLKTMLKTLEFCYFYVQVKKQHPKS